MQGGVVLMEVASSARLFGGLRTLLTRVRTEAAARGVPALAVAPTALAAQALLAGLMLQRPPPADDEPAGPGAPPLVPPSTPASADPGAAASAPLQLTSCGPRQLAARLDALPVQALPAVARHADVLRQLGCHTLGQVRQLPRGGLARRFDAALLEALDRAHGLRPDSHEWITLPDRFDESLAFEGAVEHAEGLMFGARRLLARLGDWLLARQAGVTALSLHWLHDRLRRSEITAGELPLRSARATRDTAHLGRLMAEHLARTELAAPVVGIRLEATGVEALPTASASFLPDPGARGESLQQLIERLSARLGPQRVLRGERLADHRPTHQQRWVAATTIARGVRTANAPDRLGLQPPWMLRQPLRLALKGDRPLYQGPLRLLAGPERLEAGWWDDTVQRDHFVAFSAHAGLLWIYRERQPPGDGHADGRWAWYLQGIHG